VPRAAISPNVVNGSQRRLPPPFAFAMTKPPCLARPLVPEGVLTASMWRAESTFCLQCWARLVGGKYHPRGCLSAAFPIDKRRRLPGLRGVDLKRLAFGRVLETQTFGRLGRARVFEVVDHVGHFHESLTCFERLRRFIIHFQGNGTFQDIDKPRCRMSVSSGFCARCNVCNPKIHLVALYIGQIHYQKVGSELPPVFLDRDLSNGRPS
jgi:hypothetical protein